MSFTPPESTKSRTAAVQKMDSTFIQSAMSHVAHWLLLFPALSDLLSCFCSLGATVYFQRSRREVLSGNVPAVVTLGALPAKMCCRVRLVKQIILDSASCCTWLPVTCSRWVCCKHPRLYFKTHGRSAGVVSSTKTASFPCVASLKCRFADFTPAAIFKANTPTPSLLPFR